jgi:hypothetical protein
MIMLTDAEQAFADSPAGQNAIAFARESHRLREAHRGDRARPWTDADEATAIRTVSTRAARASVGTVADAANLPVLRAQAEAAYASFDHNAWRKAG